jgi:hypothetical protein
MRPFYTIRPPPSAKSIKSATWVNSWSANIGEWLLSGDELGLTYYRNGQLADHQEWLQNGVEWGNR